MTESFQGIQVPRGSVGGLREQSRGLAGQAEQLSNASVRLRGMPSAPSSWLGPAHGRYANMCVTGAQAADLGSRSFLAGSAAAAHYANALERAQTKAKAAIAHARAAQRRIDVAKQNIATAQADIAKAEFALAAARAEQTIGSIAGAPSGAEAAVRQAEHELHEGQRRLRHWTHELHAAEDELRRAHRLGQEADADATGAAQRAHTAFQQAGGMMPRLAPPPPPARPVDHRGAGTKVLDWLGDQASGFGGAVASEATGAWHTVRQIPDDVYDRFAHPGEAYLQDLQRQGREGDALLHPVRTAENVVGWNDLSHGRVGAWLGHLAPAAAAGALTDGAGALTRTARATARSGRVLRDGIKTLPPDAKRQLFEQAGDGVGKAGVPFAGDATKLASPFLDPAFRDAVTAKTGVVTGPLRRHVAVFESARALRQFRPEGLTDQQIDHLLRAAHVRPN